MIEQFMIAANVATAAYARRRESLLSTVCMTVPIRKSCGSSAKPPDGWG